MIKFNSEVLKEAPKTTPFEGCIPYIGIRDDGCSEIFFRAGPSGDFIFFEESEKCGVSSVSGSSEHWIRGHFVEIRKLKENEGFTYKFTE